MNSSKRSRQNSLRKWHLIQQEKNRRQARQDPNAFLELVLSQPDKPFRQAMIHKELQDFLTRNPRALIELPRDHGKSTQVCARVLWELGRQPNLRIVLVCGNEKIALERSGFIRQQLQTNPWLFPLFPHLRPGRPWGTKCFHIAGQRARIGPSVTALGIGAGSTGVRADLLICDDIVDVKSLYSARERRRVESYFRENLMNLLEPQGRLWNLFTPWHQDDLNARLKASSAYAHFRRAIDEDLTPLWPEHWPRERLLQRRREIGTIPFARAYHLKPLVEADTLILLKWIRFRERDKSYSKIVLAIDPAISTTAQADCSALVVLGLRDNREMDCLEALGRRIRPPELIELIRQFDALWKPDAILFEQNGAFRAVFEMLQSQAGFAGRLIGITQSVSKLARVQAFSVLVETGRFYLRGQNNEVSPEQKPLFDEMISFPLGDHDDLLDAAAMAAQWLSTKTELRVW
ncbi:hypothetical protein KIH39_19065 [Telmatocola sphagniphila]|uniref:Terminase large subunit gp17-like C-terminal domain-containing protein n=1 Tax=Telmatocola sphagniphila TaxID=1123043 RepID=A0A8E6EU85_9BACT|nr:hypothetical protein [Telmatocola sphagniphila]QVL30937.1 hypothetical protein KIH39_19065 [Telmatocola sphagniphila]